jgi:restriction system protein
MIYAAVMTSALDDHWTQPLPDNHVPNGFVLQNLRAALGDGEPIVELIGLPGSGKTSVLRSFVQDRPALFDGAVEYFSASPSFPLTEAVDVIAERFRLVRGRHLLVIDNGEQGDPGELLEGINRLGTGPWRFSTIVASRTPLHIGRAVQVGPLNFDDMHHLLEAQFDQQLPPDVIAKLWTASKGVPNLAKILADEWRTGRVPSFDLLAGLFSPLAVPGLVDSSGRPLARGSHEEKTIISDVRFVSDALLKAVGKEPELVHALLPREFEELSAELFQRQGYEVTITPQTRDGGKDLYLAKADGFGSFLFIVECKRYAPDNPVDVGVVRALYGVAQHERVTAAMTLTTSYFSKDAKDFAADIQYQLTLKDFVGLKQLLDPYRDS